MQNKPIIGVMPLWDEEKKACGSTPAILTAS